MNAFRVITFFFLTLSATVVYAAEDPADKLQTTVETAIETFYGECCADQTTEEKRARVYAALEESYDLEVMIRYSIGRNWKRMKPAEQIRVVELIKQLVVKAYTDGIDGKARPEVSFGETRLDGNRAEVPSVVILDGKSINVLYRMASRENGWQIYDIVVEDISVGQNFRHQFDDHFRRNNAKELIAKLEELLKKDKLDEEVKI